MPEKDPAQEMAREHVLKYVLSGKPTFTILSHGKRRTYKIVKQPQKDKPNEYIWFVSALTGSDNESDYTWFGLIFEPNKFVHPKSSKLEKTAISVRLFNYFWKWVLGTLDEDEIAFYPSGRCGRCGRKLTDPDSITTGLGPECAGK